MNIARNVTELIGRTPLLALDKLSAGLPGRVVAKLERGEGTLEESLALYEEGVALVRSAHGMLDAAEKRLEVLKPQADGSFRLEESAADPGQAADADEGGATG